MGRVFLTIPRGHTWEVLVAFLKPEGELPVVHMVRVNAFHLYRLGFILAPHSGLTLLLVLLTSLFRAEKLSLINWGRLRGHTFRTVNSIWCQAL